MENKYANVVIIYSDGYFSMYTSGRAGGLLLMDEDHFRGTKEEFDEHVQKMTDGMEHVPHDLWTGGDDD